MVSSYSMNLWQEEHQSNRINEGQSLQDYLSNITDGEY